MKKSRYAWQSGNDRSHPRSWTIQRTRIPENTPAQASRARWRAGLLQQILSPGVTDHRNEWGDIVHYRDVNRTARHVILFLRSICGDRF